MAGDDRPTDDGRRGRPDVPRVGDLAPDEVEALVRRRRRRRKIKALAALGLATAAGVFLSCAGRRTPGPTPPERDAGTDASDGMDGGMDAGIRDAAVDVEHHRDGMPVPDNLLE